MHHHLKLELIQIRYQQYYILKHINSNRKVTINSLIEIWQESDPKD